MSKNITVIQWSINICKVQGNDYLSHGVLLPHRGNMADDSTKVVLLHITEWCWCSINDTTHSLPRLQNISLKR